MRETSPLYSIIQDKIVTFNEKVVEIAKEMEDLLISLAGYRGETLDSLRKKSLADIQLLTRKYNNDHARRSEY